MFRKYMQLSLLRVYFLCHALNYEANCQKYTTVLLKQELNLVQKMKRLWSF